MLRRARDFEAGLIFFFLEYLFVSSSITSLATSCPSHAASPVTYSQLCTSHPADRAHVRGGQALLTLTDALTASCKALNIVMVDFPQLASSVDCTLSILIQHVLYLLGPAL